MLNKITEIIVEPTKIHVGSIFRLKIKAIRYATYNELKDLNYTQLKNKFYKNWKGD